MHKFYRYYLTITSYTKEFSEREQFSAPFFMTHFRKQFQPVFFHLTFLLLHFKVLTFSCKCVIMAKDVTEKSSNHLSKVLLQ